jgi:hypothetical protein
MDADPWDETHWKHANPALGDFLRVESMREQAWRPAIIRSRRWVFASFRLNQWQVSTVRWMRMDLWDQSAGTVFKSNRDALNAFAGAMLVRARPRCPHGLDEFVLPVPERRFGGCGVAALGPRGCGCEARQVDWRENVAVYPRRLADGHRGRCARTSSGCMPMWRRTRNAS